MYRHVLAKPFHRPPRVNFYAVCLRPKPKFAAASHFLRQSHTDTTNLYESKYAERLHQRAKEQGLSVAELKAKIKKEQDEQARRKRDATPAPQPPPENLVATDAPQSPTQAPKSPLQNVRKDSSPVRPLSSILNIPRILATPHTAAQISGLWTAYHLSRSNGTGRGYVCASIPLDLYQKMADIAGQYSSFVVPVPRLKDPTAPVVEGEEDTAYEFYFMQWGFHSVPPIPSATEDLFAKTPSAPPPGAGSNPPTSTILFTPLQEYKMRASFATPYLVLTHYTDFAQSHGVVLLRGEITPSSASGGAGVDGRYMLNQEDAQLLSMSVQKFYLWSKKDGQEREGERLLKTFHEKPEQFAWEELLKHASWTV